MKRIISVLSAFLLTSTAFSGFVLADEEAVSVTAQEEFCFKTGIFTKTDYNKDKKLTRGDFTEVIANLCNLEVIKVDESQWNDLMYGEGSTEDSGVLFEDVDRVHPDYATIKAVVKAGYMKGISESLFGPELYITENQVYKVLFDMIGYKSLAELSGGYPAGYIAISSEQGVGSNVRADKNGYLTYGELSKIIYNMLDVQVMEFDYSSDASYVYSENENKTFMNHVMGIEVETGFLTDNGYTAFDGESEIPADYVKVGAVQAKISAESEYMRDFLGQYVELYYKYDDKDEYNNESVYMIPKQTSNEVYSFRADDFISYKDNTIKYYNENGREKNISLSPLQYLVVNNEATGDIREDNFKFDDGKITVIPQSVNGKTVIVVESVEYAFVNTTNSTENSIYNKLSNFQTITKLDSYENVAINFANGDSATLEDIKPSVVLEIVRNSKDIKITISASAVSNYNITNITENDDGKTVISNGEVNYIVSKQYSKASNKVNFKTSKNYTIYLNSKNEVVWVDTKTTNYSVAYLLKAWVDDTGDKALMKVCSMDAAFSTYTLDEKVKISDTEGKEHKGILAEEIVTLINKNELIRFKVNDNGLVTYIELPLNEVPAQNDRLHKVVDNSNSTGTLIYQWGGGGFGGSLSYVNNVPVLRIPANLSDVKKFEKTTPLGAFEGNNNTRPFVAYSTLNNDFIAEYIIALPKKNEIDSIKDGRDFLAVQSINDVIDEDDQMIKEIKGYLVYGTKTSVAVKNVTMYCAADELEIVQNMRDIYHNAVVAYNAKNNKNEKTNDNEYELKPGDIIRLKYDEYNYIALAELVFRPTLTNPASPEGVKGALAGSSGYFVPGKFDSNPIALESGIYTPNKGKNITGMEFRLALSFVNAKYDNVLQVTTQDLSVAPYDKNQGYNPNTNPTGRYMVDALQISSIPSLIYIEYNNGKVVEMRNAQASDIRSYEEVGADCSRLLHNWYWGGGIHGFVINGN